MPGVMLESVGFDGDHVHMIMVIPPKYSISDVIRDLKSQSTVCLRNKFSWLKDVYWKENVFWSPGFFVSSVGVDEEVIRKYIEHQGKEDSGQSDRIRSVIGHNVVMQRLRRQAPRTRSVGIYNWYVVMIGST